MHFKKLFSSTLLLILTAACSSPFNDGEKNGVSSNTINLGSDSASAQCLENASATIQRYFDGNSNVDEMTRFWDCSTNALKLFSKYMHGKDSHQYDADELRIFLERNYLGGRKIHSQLLVQGMKLKKAILGGSETFLTKLEIDKTLELISVLKSESIALLPYQPIRSSNYNLRTLEQIKSMTQAVVAASENIGSSLSKTATPYAIDGIQHLLEELNVFLSQSNSKVIEIDGLIELLPAIKSFKRILLYGSNSDIERQDWKNLLGFSAKWYCLYLNSENLRTRFESWMSGQALEQFAYLADEGAKYFTETLKLWPKQTIPFNEIDALVDSISPERYRKWFEILEFVTPSTIKSVTRPFVQRIMGGAYVGKNGRDAEGLSLVVFERMFGEIQGYFKSQFTIEKIYSNIFSGQEWNDLTPVANENIFKAISSLKNDKSVSATQLEEQRAIAEKYRPMFYSEGSRVSFLKPGDFHIGHTFQDISKMNFYRLVSRLIIAGYATNLDYGRRHLGVTEKEFAGEYNPYNFKEFRHRGAYLDFYDLGMELKFFQKYVNPNDRKSGGKRFMEGNLFTLVADGNNYLDIDEMAQLFAILGSAKSLSLDAHKQYTAVCGAVKYDEFKRAMIDSKCVMDHFFDRRNKDYAVWLNTMPIMVDYYEALDDIGKQAFQDSLKGAFLGTKEPLKILTADDFDTLSTMMHYTEAMFARYDLDYSDWLEEGEATTNAFPVFKSTLADFSGMKVTDTKKLRALFKYLLYKGKPPARNRAKFVWWWWVEGNFVTIQADRTKVFNIFASILALEDEE